MDKRNNDFAFDFKPIGQAIKAARKTQGMTREQLARILDYAPRHIQAIENEGQYCAVCRKRRFARRSQWKIAGYRAFPR